jgi:hypothetical protein
MVMTDRMVEVRTTFEVMSASLAVMAIIVGMHFSVLFTLVQYLRHVLDYTPLIAGLACLPLTATVFGIS